MNGRSVWRASPSLALTKYWGKAAEGMNIPATSSVAVTLGGLTTTTTVETADVDDVWIDGAEQPRGRFAEFFSSLRGKLGVKCNFRAESANSFPTAAGLASSSSGFAALACACADAAGANAPPRTLSALARIGSASAARSIFGGFVALPAGAEAAEPLYPSDYWPDLRFLVAVTEAGAKLHSSRDAMSAVARTSPYYSSWTADAPGIYSAALGALQQRDVDSLGRAMRLSYMRMHASALGGDPPILYWNPGSIRVIALCEDLRREGMSAWETMDAGPQVKIMCLHSDIDELRRRVEATEGVVRTITAAVGDAASRVGMR